MLRLLNIHSFAVVQRLRVEFREGLNLLTGETGAGKSILVDALGLLLGGRGGLNSVRSGERAALIEGAFDLEGERAARVAALLSEVGLDGSASEDGLILRRELQAAGRSRFFVNDQSVTAQTLKMIQPLLVEIHGQGDQQILHSARAQLELFDSFAGCQALRQQVSAAYERLREATQQLRGLDQGGAARERAADMLRYQLEEIERAAPLPGEDAALAAERIILANSEKIVELGAGAYTDLYESDSSVLTQLSSVQRKLQELNQIDPRAASISDNCQAASLLLEDASTALRHYAVNFESSATRLNEVEDRLAELERLKRKYGRDLQGVLEERGELHRRLEDLSDVEGREQRLLAEVKAADEAYRPLAKQLSQRRSAAVQDFQARVTTELAQLALEKSVFELALHTTPAPKISGDGWQVLPGLVNQRQLDAPSDNESLSYWNSRGADRIELLFSANPGETPRPLSKVASGGELSRLMLALRTVCGVGKLKDAGQALAGTLIFDEVDAGIGGRVATSVGAKLKSLAAQHQVLCVTHQPQVASYADHHLVVGKQVMGERTFVEVIEVAGEGRVGEIARMIGGDAEAVSARDTARWMLAAKESSAVPARTRKEKASRNRRGNSATLRRKGEPPA